MMWLKKKTEKGIIVKHLVKNTSQIKINFYKKVNVKKIIKTDLLILCVCIILSGSAFAFYYSLMEQEYQNSLKTNESLEKEYIVSINQETISKMNKEYQDIETKQELISDLGEMSLKITDLLISLKEVIPNEVVFSRITFNSSVIEIQGYSPSQELIAQMIEKFTSSLGNANVLMSEVEQAEPLFSFFITVSLEEE